ncbi:hypothetical protein GQ457_09G018860 [Hibiscus cannabinus]
MASTSGNNLYEAQSITKPPYFSGDNYPYWKIRMRIFIKSNDYQVWDVVEDGPIIPSKREGDWLIPKTKLEMTDEDRRRMQINDKEMHMMFCALGPDEYAKMSSSTSAKEIWDKLETTYEGTNDVKETQIGLLNLSYENFKMEPDEEITMMFDRFSVIVNGLKGLGEVIPEEKLVRKLIYSLPESWDKGDDDHPAPPVDAPLAHVSPPPNDALLAYLEGKFTALDTRMSSIDPSIVSLRTSFDTRFTSLESKIGGIETSIAGFHHEWRTLSHGDDDDHDDYDDDGATV